MSYLEQALVRHIDLIEPGKIAEVWGQARLILDGTPCNEARGWYGEKPGCTRDPAKSAANKTEKKKNSTRKTSTGKVPKAKVEAAIAENPKTSKLPNKTKKKVVEAALDKVNKKQATKSTPLQKLTDDGQMLSAYSGTIKGEGKPNEAMTRMFEDGKTPWNPALVVSDGKTSTAIGKQSGEIIASLNAAKNQDKARGWTIQVPNSPAEIKSAESLQVSDKEPYSTPRNWENKGLKISDVGEYLSLYPEDIKAGTGGHSGTKKQLAQAVKDLKSADRNWVPVLVKQSGKGFEVVGNHFAYEAAQKAGLGRIRTIVVE